MTETRMHFASAVYHQRIVACGGVVGQKTSQSCEIFNPLSQAWAIYTPMLLARAHFALSMVGNTLYIVGGVNAATGDYDSIEYYEDYVNATFLMYQKLAKPCAGFVTISIP